MLVCRILLITCETQLKVIYDKNYFYVMFTKVTIYTRLWSDRFLKESFYHWFRGSNTSNPQCDKRNVAVSFATIRNTVRITTVGTFSTPTLKDVFESETNAYILVCGTGFGCLQLQFHPVPEPFAWPEASVPVF